MLNAIDEKFMRAALAEAAKGVGHTSPNPAVGAVIVRNGRIIARGWHRRAGEPHAEIEAIRALRKPELACGSTIYVTLEPCSTHGRTPPCCDAIKAHGFGRVVVGAVDPNPKHAGRGLELLRKAGVDVVAGVLNDECNALNRAFNRWITKRMPWVIAKAGLSLDGRLTRPPGEGQWLTSERSRAHAMKLRARVDAILVGAETVRADDPKLTIRGVGGFEQNQPWRVVVTQSGRLPKKAALFTDAHRERTLVYTGQSLRAVLKDLARRQVTSVLIEGGGQVLGEAFDRRLVDEVHFYMAPILCGGPTVIGGRGADSTAESIVLADPQYERLGDDIHVSGICSPLPVL
jgi:diaminohydroxyphosphoribosylaminopyrimidine deaminase/5-amino-6-(5-phosphoribosylamino)uracil reductase